MVAIYRVTIFREAIWYSKTLLKSDTNGEQGQVSALFHVQTLEMNKNPRQETLQTLSQPHFSGHCLPVLKTPQGSIATRHWNSLPCGLFHYILCSLACHDSWQRLGWWNHKRWDERDNKNLKPFKKAKHECKNTGFTRIFIYIIILYDYMYSGLYKILINLETRPILYPGVWFGFKYNKKKCTW